MAWAPQRRQGPQRVKPQHKQKTSERGYGWDWQKLRRQMGFTETTRPLCADCEENDRVTPAEHIHHKVKIVVDPSKRLDPSNLVCLCSKCHEIRTSRGE